MAWCFGFWRLIIPQACETRVQGSRYSRMTAYSLQTPCAMRKKRMRAEHLASGPGVLALGDHGTVRACDAVRRAGTASCTAVPLLPATAETAWRSRQPWCANDNAHATG